jgi:preprotein translocase subunit YajC
MKKFLTISFLLPQLAVAQEPAHSQMFSTISMIALAVVFFYFLLWRPEQKRRKTAEKMRSSLKKGDRVTAMGIVGTVARVMDHTVVLKMIDGAKIEMLKAAITDVQPGPAEENEKSDESSES